MTGAQIFHVCGLRGMLSRVELRLHFVPVDSKHQNTQLLRSSILKFVVFMAFNCLTRYFGVIGDYSAHLSYTADPIHFPKEPWEPGQGLGSGTSFRGSCMRDFWLSSCKML